MDPGSDHDDGLLREQLVYYRAVAAEYLDGQLDEPGAEELVAAVDRFAPRGEVLELACGPGIWTPQLLRHATTVTALDASPEMLRLARARVAPDRDRVRFVRADLFSWRPDRRYDVVFAGFWLSHVPWDRFGRFWRSPTTPTHSRTHSPSSAGPSPCTPPQARSTGAPAGGPPPRDHPRRWR